MMYILSLWENSASQMARLHHTYIVSRTVRLVQHHRSSRYSFAIDGYRYVHFVRGNGLWPSFTCFPTVHPLAPVQAIQVSVKPVCRLYPKSPFFQSECCCVMRFPGEIMTCCYKMLWRLVWWQGQSHCPVAVYQKYGICPSVLSDKESHYETLSRPLGLFEVL